MHPFPMAMLLLASPVLLDAARAGTPANSCTDAYWSDTLRCRVAPMSLPQPAVPAPTTPAAVKDYMRVDLVADMGIRCADGTRPVIYVDPAVGGPSNDWLISLTGGGACSALDSDANGSFENGQPCADVYADAGERDEMGTAAEPAMKYLGNLPAMSEGILKPDLASNPVFARFHRVRIEKCSYDRHNGLATHAGLAAPTSPNSTAPGWPIRRIWRASSMLPA